METRIFFNPGDSIANIHDYNEAVRKGQIFKKERKIDDLVIAKGPDDEEYAIIKSHAPNGYEILKDIKIMPSLSLGAGYHHERVDGKGYPKGLKKDEIPLIARIIAVADTFDAMYSNRPYRKKMKLEDVIAEINRVKGTQLCDEVVDVVNKLYEEGLLDDIDSNSSTDNDVHKEAEENRNKDK